MSILSNGLKNAFKLSPNQYRIKVIRLEKIHGKRRIAREYTLLSQVSLFFEQAYRTIILYI